jgi:hypothetical protein
MKEQKQEPTVKFGDRIDFFETFKEVVYINEYDLVDSKLYSGDSYTIVPEKASIARPGEIYFPPALRKLIFQRGLGSGIVIGQKRMHEGFYNPGGRPMRYPDDYESPYLEITKVYSMWVVAVGMNKTVLVPKFTIHNV